MKIKTNDQIKTINAIVSRVTRTYSRWSQRRDVNTYAAGILYALVTEGLITQKQYVENYDVPKQTVNNIITSLKKDGYIIMQQNTEDKREKMIVLTEEGVSYANELLSPLFEIESKVVEKIGEKGITDLINSLMAFSNILDEEMKKDEDNSQ